SGVNERLRSTIVKPPRLQNTRHFMRVSDFIARTVTQRRTLVWCGVVLLTVACIALLTTSLQLDSEIFNVLPGKFSSVQGLKIYDRDFEQTRELTFALLCEPNDIDKLDEFAPVFAERLRQQPWCTRVLAGSPMSAPDGIRDLQLIAVPLLLNLEPNAFRETIAVLQPEKIRDRLHRLREQIEAGSPRPEFELSFDPLGLIAPALKPFAESTIIEQEQPLTSTDRTMRVFLVVTNQQSISAFECQRLMREVNKFRAIAAEGWNPKSHSGLQVLVTGRSAFASEISLSMRYDVVATLLGSVFLVGTIFFVGFRRWLPLLGMALCLLLSCLVALTLGQLLFGRLSMISVGFCAILFLFVRERQAIPHDWLFESVRKYVRWIVRKPVPMLLFSTVLLLVLTAIGFSPNPPLHFETNTRSLQPRNIRASQALEAI